MFDPELGIIIPAYEAARTLHATLGRIPQDALPRLRVIVVDDGSADETSAEARRAASDHGLALEVLRHETNRGYGAVQKSGYARSLALGCRLHALIHADGQYAPEELPQVLEPLRRGEADVVVGSRILHGGAVRQGMPLARYLGNRLISTLENFVFGLRFTEYHSGYVAYSSEALRRIPYQTLSDRFHFDGEMLLAAGKLGVPVAEVPVSTHFGEETSSLNPAPYLIEIGGVIVRYWRGGYSFAPRGPRPRRGR